MRVTRFICAALVATLLPAAALADDPNDPTMRDPAARARDHEQIRQLNLRESAMVQRRDAGYAEGWQAWREAQSQGDANARRDEYAQLSRDHEFAMADYARNRADYERQMTAWRRAVAACRAGDYSACGQ